jgi:hypothetical protein
VGIAVDAASDGIELREASTPRVSGRPGVTNVDGRAVA